MRRLSRLTLVAFVLAGGVGLALGHSVWIEPDAGNRLVVRFGEPGEKPETSPGHLDSVAPPVAFVITIDGSARVVDAPRRHDQFALEGVSATDRVGLETAYAVMTVPGNPASPGRKPLFYARWQPTGAGAGRPALTLDLVPTGEPGEVRVYFRGKPLGGIAATLRTPDGKERELRSDAVGYLRFECDQVGLHHLSIARHREPVGGFHGGVAYETTSHNAALTWIQP